MILHIRALFVIEGSMCDDKRNTNKTVTIKQTPDLVQFSDKRNCKNNNRI